jgi:Putative Actinobacterial Holin-X, holin superfamily III
MTPEPSLADHFRELATELGDRVRQELALARAEITEKLGFAGRQTALIGIGAICTAVSVVVLAGAAVLTLGQVLPLWLAAIAVALALGATGQLLVRKATAALRTMSLIPTETLAAIGADASWVEHELHETLEDAKHKLVIAAAPEPAPAPVHHRRKPAATTTRAKKPKR